MYEDALQKETLNPTIETNKTFKENIKNMFLYLNEMMVNCVLLSEHFYPKLSSDDRETFDEILNKELERVQSKMKSAFNSIYDNVITKSEAISYFPLFYIEKADFKKEKKYIRKQFTKLRQIDYDSNFNINKIFLARIEDFVKTVKEDSTFEIPKGLELEEVKKRYKEEAEKEDEDWANYSDDDEGGVEAIGEQDEDDEGEEEHRKNKFFEGYYQITGVDRDSEDNVNEVKSVNNGIGPSKKEKNKVKKIFNF